MFDYGINITVLNKLNSQYGVDVVAEKFCMMKKALERGQTIKNPAGWLRTALKDGYVDTSVEYKKIQEKEKAEKRKRAEALRKQQEEALLNQQEETAAPSLGNKSQGIDMFHAYVNKLKNRAI